MASTRRRFSQKQASFGAARKERGHGSGSCSLCRTGCAQEERVRLRDLLRDERREAAGEAKLRDRDGRAAEFGRLAERTCRDPRRHGVDASAKPGRQSLQKLLQQANVKLSSVASDAMGVSGQQMIEAMIAGEQDP